jgi:RNA polymerase sigma-70 factor (ECF subfamily)
LPASIAFDFVRKNRGARAIIVNKLLAEQRQAIWLALFTGLTHQEIAALNQPLGTIKARIRRGLLELRDRMAV